METVSSATVSRWTLLASYLTVGDRLLSPTQKPSERSWRRTQEPGKPTMTGRLNKDDAETIRASEISFAAIIRSAKSDGKRETLNRFKLVDARTWAIFDQK